jgi:hypothetical protein
MPFCHDGAIVRLPSGALTPKTFKKDGKALTYFPKCQNDGMLLEEVALTRSNSCGVITFHNQSRREDDAPHYCFWVHSKGCGKVHAPFALISLIGFIDESLVDV